MVSRLRSTEKKTASGVSSTSTIRRIARQLPSDLGETRLRDNPGLGLLAAHIPARQQKVNQGVAGSGACVRLPKPISMVVSLGKEMLRPRPKKFV